MSTPPQRFVFLGLSLSSAWGNGHATTYRALIAALAARGHQILFLERETPWYSANRDLVDPNYCTLRFYSSIAQLRKFRAEIASADAVIVGSYVPQGAAVAHLVQETARGITAFYDIDTPVTLTKLKDGSCEYLTPDLIPAFDLYLSFTSGPALRYVEAVYGAPAARALYCSVDPARYRPMRAKRLWDLGYLGTYSADRQTTLEQLLIEPARRMPKLRFVVAGAQYPRSIRWPANVERIDHIQPADHAAFYSGCGWTLNVTRADMISLGHSPSVRLFEAAACATPIISDSWPGLDELLEPNDEIIIAKCTEDVLKALHEPHRQRRLIGRAAQRRVLAKHTAAHRAREFETYIEQTRGKRQSPRRDELAISP